MTTNTQLLELATELSNKAKDLIVAHGSPKEIAEKSSRSDIVTEVDELVERMIRSELRAVRPEDSILGEEQASYQGESEYTWVIDPIDGTTNFVYDIPNFAVSIAVIHEDQCVAAVVYDIGNDELYRAERGRGASRNGKSISPTSITSVKDALVGTGFSYDSKRRGRQAQTLLAMVETFRDIRRAGAASIDICWVACGRLDAFYEQGLWPWDYKAAELIATEAGAKVGSLNQDVAQRTLTIASNPFIFNEFRGLIKKSLVMDVEADYLDD